MGNINCHCQLQQNGVLSGNNNSEYVLGNSTPAHNPSKCPQQPIVKKPKSRVNSIISPHQIMNHRVRSVSAFEILQNRGNQNQLDSLDNSKNLKGSKCKVQYFLCSKFSGILQLDLFPIKLAATSSLSNQQNIFDVLHHLDPSSQFQQFAISMKYLENFGKLYLKDNGLGLGVFQLRKEFTKTFNPHSIQTSSTLLLDVGIGQFLVINLTLYSSDSSKGRLLSGHYSIIGNKRQIKSNTQISKSLPSLFWQGSKKQNIDLKISPGQRKQIKNVQIEIDNCSLTIKGKNKEGFYLYLSDYQQINGGDIIRLGATLYEVDYLKNHKNKDIKYLIYPKA